MLNLKRGFVLLPFSQTSENHTAQYWSRHFNSYLKPLIERDETIQATRLEAMAGNESLNQTIFELLQSDIVIADLTNQDPNVVWALAVRQSFKNSTIVIAEANSPVPAYFSKKEILFYSGDYLDKPFEKKFQSAIDACLKTPPEPDSPVLETLGGRGTLYGVVHNEENFRRAHGLLMELSVNERLLEQIFENCTRNLTLRLANRADAKRMTTTPLKTGAVQFLLINCYLDLDKSFYSTLYAYHNYLEAINGHLIEWESTNTDKEVEEWLLASKEATYKNLNKLKEYLQPFK
jgi:hypothetical protein